MNITEQIKKEAERQHPTYFGHQKAFIDGADWILSTLQVPVWVRYEDEKPEDIYNVHWRYTDTKNPISIGQAKYFMKLKNPCISWLKSEPLLPLLESQKKIEELEEKILDLEKRLAK